MYQVSFHTTWGESNEDFLESIKRQTPRESARWGSIEGIADSSVADYHVVFNQPRSDINSANTFFFSAEPPISDLYCDRNLADFAGAFPIETHYKPQRWWVGQTYDELVAMGPPDKTRQLSWITTDKGKDVSRIVSSLRKIARRVGWEEHSRRGTKFVGEGPTDGHIQRMAFYDRLSSNYPEIMDHYGRGKFNGPQYRGEVKDKWDGLEKYRYSLAIENYQGPHYFSEKITDALLAWCMPIYWGCTNLSDYLPEDSYVRINIDDPSAPHRVKEIVESERREQNINAIAEARRLIIEKYQIWPTVERVVENYEECSSDLP